MKLIGMLDSPYVRRVAISLKRLGIAFDHDPLSVFRTFDQFRHINPVVKAPTLICDGGEVLMDSTLILEYIAVLPGVADQLMPATLPERIRALRMIGLALAACEKAVQLVYERTLRPAEKQHAPWIERVSLQLLAACDELEKELRHQPLAADAGIGQDGITLAVTWSFIRMMLPQEVDPGSYPLIDQFTAEAEKLDIFAGTPMQ